MYNVKLTTFMIHRQRKLLLQQYNHRKNCLKCDIRIFTLWNWEKNACYFTM